MAKMFDSPSYYYMVRRWLSLIFVLILVPFYPAVKKKIQKQMLTLTTVIVGLLVTFKFYKCGGLIKVIKDVPCFEEPLVHASITVIERVWIPSCQT